MATYSKNRLLIVDDDPVQCSMTARLMALRGFEVATYTDPELAYVALYDKLFHCIIVDAAMPEMSGSMFIELVRRKSDIPIVVITAYVGYENDKSSAVFLKPPDWDIVGDTCKKLSVSYAEKRNAERTLRSREQRGDLQEVPVQ